MSLAGSPLQTARVGKMSLPFGSTFQGLPAGSSGNVSGSNVHASAKSQPPRLEEAASRVIDTKLGERSCRCNWPACGAIYWKRSPILFFATSDISKRLLAAQDLREFAEIYQSYDYLGFVKIFITSFIAVFDNISPSFKSDSAEHVSLPDCWHALSLIDPFEIYPQRIRHALLEILRRIPNFEPIRKFAKQLMALLLKVLKEDNEENGELTMKILSEMLRSCKEECEEFAIAFFEQVKSFFAGMRKTVDLLFGTSGTNRSGDVSTRDTWQRGQCPCHLTASVLRLSQSAN